MRDDIHCLTPIFASFHTTPSYEFFTHYRTTTHFAPTQVPPPVNNQGIAPRPSRPHRPASYSPVVPSLCLPEGAPHRASHNSYDITIPQTRVLQASPTLNMEPRHLRFGSLDLGYGDDDYTRGKRNQRAAEPPISYTYQRFLTSLVPTTFLKFYRLLWDCCVGLNFMPDPSKEKQVLAPAIAIAIAMQKLTGYEIETSTRVPRGTGAIDETQKNGTSPPIRPLIPLPPHPPPFHPTTLPTTH
ncbi:hypothetical protein BU23DRAFT_664355 [Bimuria novae-zelandiae CBS 107.79]|uniref:Uncharacterized protein n=1 Tax=Bimuria novae-zelandiae CBS 107.79 TaxID=1447943 RepID=A0A6A5UND3_9PLEO|nr:hypothetical protein BU23DRAFT_664355 [Bimuria novae-zelandiae CBS 107.79]